VTNFFVDGCITLGEGEQELLHTLCDKVAHKGMQTCEVGCWVGYGTKEIACVVKKHEGIAHCVDWFKGVPEIPGAMPSGETNDIFSIFKNNMKKLELWDNICVMHMTSKQAASIVKDNTFDLIFIDAGHSYPYIREDIDMWLPKLKSGGIICGHDCECKLEEMPFTPEELASYLNKDVDCVNGIHPGVVQAVFETFPNAKQERPDGQGIWWFETGKVNWK